MCCRSFISTRLQVTGGSCSLLFEHNPRNAVLQATSGYGVDELLTDPWAPSDAEGALVSETFVRRAPTFVSDLVQQMPDLSERLKTPAALLVPLVRGAERSGLLVIGFTDAPDADVVESRRRRSARPLSDVARTLQAATERGAGSATSVELLDDFSAGLSNSLNIARRTRRRVSRRQPAVWRGSHVGLDSRSAGSPSRVAGLVGRRSDRARVAR